MLGWEAIDNALERLYPGVEPKHYGTLIKWRLGGPDPLDGVSIYPRDCHWHYVSYGMSELYEKESDDPAESGWGFEFTMRVARSLDEQEPPVWPTSLLQNLARYVFNSGNTFAIGHHLDLQGPIALEEQETAIRAVTFAEDPELGTIDTPHGRVVFLQIVGITLEEYAVIERWDAGKLAAALAPHLPMLVTDVHRGDLTTEPAVAAAIEEGAARDGSSTGSFFVQEASLHSDGDGVVLTIGAAAAQRIGRVLAARLPFGRGLLVNGPECGVGFLPGEHDAVADRGHGFAELTLTPATLTELVQTLRPVAGAYPVGQGLVVRIVKSLIRDPQGAVVREIG